LEGLWISAERWYFSILVFWVFVIIAAGAVKLAALRRSVMLERVRLEKLVNQNSLLAKESDKYKQLSVQDHLTGMLNRQGVADYIEEYFPAGAQRLVSLIIIDIDHFKLINDMQGHDGGDKVLSKVAEIIKTNIRQTDRVARWGGEEFVVILPDMHTEETHIVAEKLRSKIANTRFDDFPELVVTVSLGVGAHHCEDHFNHLFRRVDVALYQAKAQGRNRTVLAAAE
jgi:diguanylate cyclase (GGDEF)-like protein